MHDSATIRSAANAALDRLLAVAASCRGGCLAAAASLILAALLAALPAPAARAAACPNEAFRSSSPHLADCRAYEMVSPTEMNGNGIEQAFAIGADGNGVVFGTLNAFGDAQSSVAAKWVARRGAGGWSSASLNPLAGGRVPSAYDEPVVMAAAADLSRILIGSRYPFDPFDQAPYVNLVNPGNSDIYRVAAGNASEWISHGPALPETASIDRALGGASADLSRVFFETKAPLTPATAKSTAPNLYESAGGAVRTVNVDATGALIPGGAGVGRGMAAGASFYKGSEFGQGRSNQGQPVDATAVSADGSVVLFTAPLTPTSAPRQLYAGVRGQTVLVSSCRAGTCAGEPAPKGALFLVAPADGSAALFYSPGPLTAGAPEAGGIYRYDVAAGALSFVTAVGAGRTGLRYGGVLAASPDGAYLYLCENGTGVSLYHAGQVTPVAEVLCNAGASESSKEEPTALRAGDDLPWAAGLNQGEPHITPAAGYLFVTTEGDKIDGHESGGHAEVYLYEPGAAAPRCLSCRRDGGATEGDSLLNRSSGALVSAPSPVTSGIAVRNLSDSGQRAFFVSEEPLAPGDVNGAQDVYQWERPGSGDCGAASATYSPPAGGCVSLVSSGRDSRGAVLEGATPSGDDVFFSSYESLVPGDTGTELQLYDARVGGGIAAQHQGPPAPCAGEAGCRGPGPVAGSPTPAGSATFSGHGNVPGRCEELGARSRHLGKQAKRLRRRARAQRRHHHPRRARHLVRRARKTTKRAKVAAKRAKRCASSGVAR